MSKQNTTEIGIKARIWASTRTESEILKRIAELEAKPSSNKRKHQIGNLKSYLAGR